jgi:GDP-mannose 4,6-dehydratase
MGLQDRLYLGNLSARRDWGHAKDYVRSMHLILQRDTPDDYVVATGVTTEVRTFVQLAFSEIGFTIGFRGEGLNEEGVVTSIDADRVAQSVGEEFLSHACSLVGKAIVAVDPAYFRPTEVEVLLGDATKARNLLHWQPEYTLADIVHDMMESDVQLMKREAYLKQGGFSIYNYFE